jgi:hypothetical protein
MSIFSARIALGAVCVGLWVASAPAQGPRRAPVSCPSAGDPLRVRPGLVSAIVLDRPAKTVVVGDTEMVEAVAETDRLIVVRALRNYPGGTNLVIFGEAGAIICNASILITPGDAVRIYHGSGSQKGQPMQPRSFECTLRDCTPTDKPAPPPPPVFILPVGPSVTPQF